jgi:hypothetical protein
MKLSTKVWLASAAALVALPSIASAAIVIVRSAGAAAKAYPPGRAIPEGSSIRLGDGDMVTVLTPSSAKVLRGPGVFAVDAADRQSLAMAAGRRARFSALRTGDVARNPSLWDVDVSQSGKMCISDPAKLNLWRPSKDEATKLNIRSADGRTQTLDWAAGKDTVPWPKALPIRSGSQYSIEWPGSSDKAVVDFVTLSPKPPSDLVGAAKVLIANGCQNQLDMLVDNASKPKT